MSTLCWLPAAAPAPVSPTPDGNDWTLHVNSVSRQLLFAPDGSTLATTTYSPDAADHLVDGSSMVAQFVSCVLPPQVIPSQAIRVSMRMSEAVATNNLAFAWKLYAVNVAGNTVLGTLVAYRVSGAEVATSLTGRTASATSTAFSDPGQPFRLVLEVGFSGLPTASGSVDGHNGAMAFGCNGTDFPQDGDTTPSNPYLLFPDSDLLLGVPNTAASAPFKIEGVTYDDAGDPLGSVTVTLHKLIGSTLVYADRTTSHASTGAYQFLCWDNDAAYVVTSRKSGSPNVMDVSDLLTPVAV